MTDDRTLAPSPGRIERAWRAGIRPGSRWLSLGGLSLVLAIALEDSSLDPRPIAATLGRELARPGAPDLAVVADLLAPTARALAVLLLAAFGVAAVIAWLRHGLGPIDRATRASLGLARSRPAPVVPVLLVALVTTLVGLAGVDVLAAAARGPGADVVGLTGLYRSWATRTAWLLGGVATLAGGLELMWQARLRTQALYQSLAEVRAEQRQLGVRPR